MENKVENPVSPAWNRTENSLVLEWKCHNLAYFCGVKRERTADTDFDNADEGMTIWDFVGR